MVDDINKHEPTGAGTVKGQRQDKAQGDLSGGVLVPLHAAATRRQSRKRTATSMKQAEIRERLLRRMLENSLERAAPGMRPQLKIIK